MRKFLATGISVPAFSMMAAMNAALAALGPTRRRRAMAYATKIAAVAVAVSGAIVFCADRARAGLILDLTIVPIAGPPPAIVLTPEATGQAVARDLVTGTAIFGFLPFRTGGSQTVAVGGPPPVAVSTIIVNLTAQSITRVAAATSLGSTNGTAVGINKKLTAPPAPGPQQFDVVLTITRDPAQEIDIFLGPGDVGTLIDQLQLTELNFGIRLFDSTTTITEASPDTVVDDTGMITWSRSPGMFSGNTGGIPNVFSENRWVMDPLLLQFNFPVFLNAGESLDLNFELLETVSGSISAGDSLYGFSAFTVPEPATVTLLGAAASILLWRNWRTRTRKWVDL